MKTEPYWIEGPWPGKLAIVARPRGGDWLDDDVARWRRAGLDEIVSLLTDRETMDFEIGDEPESCRRNHIIFHSFPIPDRGLPASRETAKKLLKMLGTSLIKGKKIALHCRQGVGRSAMIAASLLTASGLNAAEAFARIGAARGCAVPDTEEQVAWVETNARALHSPPIKSRRVIPIRRPSRLQKRKPNIRAL